MATQGLRPGLYYFGPSGLGNHRTGTRIWEIVVQLLSPDTFRETETEALCLVVSQFEFVAAGLPRHLEWRHEAASPSSGLPIAEC
jgi:hypothetical protein